MPLPNPIPKFDDLPCLPDGLKGSAWGIFDSSPTERDLYGTLNFLTPAVIAAAAAEVKDGISISLNWPLNGIKFPFPHRKPPVHRPHTLAELGMQGHEGWDDEIEFNTQFSSQWDGLCHVVQKDGSGRTYNGFVPTREKLDVSESSAEVPTVEHWHARGGIVGRGVLVDYKRYVEETKPGVVYHPLDGHRITVDEIEAVARYQGVQFREGDILIVRTGYTDMLAAPTAADFEKFQKATLSGVHGAEETARWIWDHRIAAVAGDAHGFEALPPVREDGSVGEIHELVLHRYFLNGFGMPIGELWDLKALGEHCKKTGRYSFLLTSAPLNHPGLVASPPNALAIF
ncbi:putative cyclase-domain-containing protein [Echria macrotheca]|uniref:Cyclase-domain-containing protein n=1 Tax=Echria macrotheca TaxID=438768 RepID=A0AAJ0F9N0_9PEZI|nr:putative cyclase-domain-containing protein [Echria macrotheca]